MAQGVPTDAWQTQGLTGWGKLPIQQIAAAECVPFFLLRSEDQSFRIDRFGLATG
jgi:hypothetical protein